MPNKNLCFFNKEGDYLNFNYNASAELFEGDILFHENSTDTFKTYGVYMMERVPSFEFELPGELTTRKFQLFNEFGIHLYGAKYKSEKIIGIEPINNDSTFYSKWIYGDNFESKFPIGTLISFDSTLLEFNDTTITYVVVGSKKNSIMIISQMDNDTFETTYYNAYIDPNTYIDKTISGLNAVGVYDYVNDLYANNLSTWNEPDFYDKYYLGRKLNIINSDYNDSVLTIIDNNISDIPHFEFSMNESNLNIGSNIIIEVITRTDLPRIYEGGININSNGIIDIQNILDYPKILKSGVEFKIIGSINNANFLTVASIPTWNGIVNETFFATQSQVIYNNTIYQCIQSYTQSFGQQLTSFITPLDTNYWSSPTYVKVDQSTVAENILFSQLYLTRDRYYFEYGWTQSSDITLASSAEYWKEDLKLFNIDLFYENSELRADLIYPTKYAIVNFYQDSISSLNLLGTQSQKLERLVSVRENINYELNYNISENFKCNIVFTDIDEYGFKIIINKMVYDEEISYVFSGASIDMERTIDRTLRNWLTRYYLRLYSLGIRVDLEYIGNFTSVFYNSIRIRSEYPNVPVNIDDILVGSTADYYISHSRVLFTEIGPYLTININDKDYGITSSYLPSSNVTNIPDTLNRWVLSYSDSLSEFGIIVTNINNLLRFDVKRLDRRLGYRINTGKVNIPGINDFQITDKLFGNHGLLIASNEVLLPSNSVGDFEQEGFATGMVFSINNTFWPWVNQDFNIQFLDPKVMNISYQGPFWGLTDSICDSSPFITIAFNLGFGQTACSPIIGPTAGSQGGPFNISEFSSAFSISYNPNTYVINNYNLNSFQGTSGLVDIKYVQLSNSLYGFGDDVVVIDSFTTQFITSIMLVGNTQSIEMEFNPINNYIYCLSKNQINIIDPLLNVLVANISLVNDAFDMCINKNNGDVYVSYSNNPSVDIWFYNNYSPTPLTIVTPGSMTGKLVFNDFEGDMYVTTDADQVIRIDGLTRTIQTNYGIVGVTHSIFYEPINESIYVYTNTNLWKIDNGLTQSLSITSQAFNDIIFNNLTGEMNISDSSNNFTRLNLNMNTSLQSGVGNYGYLAINQFDGDVYLSSQSLNSIIIIDANTGGVIYTAPMSAQTTRTVYNPDRMSIWAIQPSINSLIEVEVTLNSTINPLTVSSEIVGENLYGTLDSEYESRPSVWLKTRDYIRRPRENFEGEESIKYYWKWFTDEVPEFFMYDFSGEQLAISGSYAYIGEKPLTDPVLNYKPNRDLDKISIPSYQQTIFDQIEYTLSYIDDEDDFSSEVEPLQLFIGFRSNEESALKSILQLYKKEEVSFSIDSDENTNITLELKDDSDRRGIIYIDDLSSNTFTNKGLKPGQHIVIYLKDITNNNNQYISDNNASIFKIREVYTKILVLDFISVNDIIINENTVIDGSTYLRLSIEVIDKEIGRFNVFGQTEDEDERFKIELGNVGKLINPDEVFIFKEYDILEGGIDWKILNRKRKEMLMMKHLIYPYIGAYKSIINAINYFGYNDLQLNEYYRNVNTESENFSKLFKVEIPDIFDNSVDGWTDNDFVKNTYPNENFEETNLFNLTYFITNKDGDNILNYSIDEIVIKLQGLKYWLKKNIIPLTHKILDITGRSYFNSGTYITHRLHDIRIINIKQEMTPITFKLNEAYLMPINSGSTVYNCVLDFYSIIPGFGTSTNSSIKPYNDSKLNLPDYFDIKIRTYKTYREWAPFTVYGIGDKVSYFGKLYESSIDSNRVKNPRKYETITSWSASNNYKVSSVVEYKRDYYVYSGLGLTSSTTSPNLDALNWLNVTEWKLIDYEPVQTISEFRLSDNLLPFNFTIDSNIDPFVVIEVTSDNGYGQIYKDRKNYEIRGLKDLTDEIRYIDPIGPFEPIAPVL